MIAIQLAVHPQELARRVTSAHCVVCGRELSYVDRYCQKRHCCDACTPKVSPAIHQALGVLDEYL
jgi:hypothetical protein